MWNKIKSLFGKSVSSSSAAPVFNHEQYTKDLDLLIKLGYDEYKHITLDRQKVQVSYLRTYLWLASAVFGAQFVFFKPFFLLEPTLPVFFMIKNTFAFYFFSILALCCSLGVFGFGIYAMRGKGVTPWPISNLLEFSNKAHVDCGGAAAPTFRPMIIANLQSAMNSQIDKVDRLGRFLRIMSWGLLFSVASSLIALFTKFH